jgi:Flp pilus assembly protein TadB
VGGQEILIFLSGAMAIGFVIAIAYLLLSDSQGNQVSSLLKASRGGETSASSEMRTRLKDDVSGDDYEELKEQQRQSLLVKKDKNQEKRDRYFHAGMFWEKEQRDFDRLRIFLPIIAAVVLALVMFLFFGAKAVLFGFAIGVLGGLAAPGFILDKRIAKRHDDIMFYLPLVIEQISIGVSSSLDIGPCVQRVVQMADERDTHNVVTEFMRLVQQYGKSGISMEEALTEVGIRSGHTELKHTFMALSQVAKHGGEVSKQLQELANAVSSHRENDIEAKINKLELKATLPVGLAFCGFIVIAITSIGIQLVDAF